MAKKIFKTSKNRALGASKEQKVAPGDMVCWKSWEFNLETEIFQTKEGLLIEIIEENRLQNIVLIAKSCHLGPQNTNLYP